jgi:hypothetical protein
MSVSVRSGRNSLNESGKSDESKKENYYLLKTVFKRASVYLLKVADIMSSSITEKNECL